MPSATLSDDVYHWVSDFLSLVGTRGVIMTEGFLSAVSNGLTFRYGDDTQPATADPGTPVAVGGSAGFGPVQSKEAGWDLRKLWVRNTTAGSNATVVLNAVRVAA